MLFKSISAEVHIMPYDRTNKTEITTLYFQMKDEKKYEGV